jgi:hypothetical protein
VTGIFFGISPFPRSKNDRFPSDELNTCLRQLTYANFGSLEILKDAERFTGFLGRFSDALDEFRVLLMRAMRKVETANIHPGFNQLHKRVDGVGSGTDGADDFCMFINHIIQYLPDHRG